MMDGCTFIWIDALVSTSKNIYLFAAIIKLRRARTFFNITPIVFF